MKETRNGAWCVMSFGKDHQEALTAAVQRGDIPDGLTFESVNNPIPTGDHWKAIDWALAYKKTGKAAIVKMPPSKRDFGKNAGEALLRGPTDGFRMTISSVAARNFREANDLRMQRGNVFVFVGNAPKAEDTDI